VVAEVRAIHFPMMGWTADSMKQKFSALANQQPGTGNPNILPLVLRVKEIKEAIKVKARISEADVNDFFEEEDRGDIEDPDEEVVAVADAE
jgi:hypothetical protein